MDDDYFPDDEELLAEYDECLPSEGITELHRLIGLALAEQD